MRKKAVKRSWSKHNVPMEIWWEILVRLPVRSLVRFRCVSRSWKVLIDDIDFCREHLVQFKNNCDETHLLMVQDWRQCFVRYSNTMKTSRRLGHLRIWDKKTREWMSTSTPGSNGLWSILFSVDGLILLKGIYFMLMLWNPSIRKCRLVPNLQDDTEFVELGIGFDPLIKDYKLVMFSMRTPSSVAIYTVGTDSWKTVAAQGALPSHWPQGAVERRSIYFKGCLYIISSSKLISFDLTKEVFKFVDLPEYEKSVGEYVGDSLGLADMGSSLAVLHFSSHVVSVWVLDDNVAAASSWTMRCSFPVVDYRLVYLKKNGDVLYDFRMVSYNIHTEEEKITKSSKITTDILGYKESLVLLK